MAVCDKGDNDMAITTNESELLIEIINSQDGEGRTHKDFIINGMDVTPYVKSYELKDSSEETKTLTLEFMAFDLKMDDAFIGLLGWDVKEDSENITMRKKKERKEQLRQTAKG